MDPIPILPEITHRIYMDITVGNTNKNESEDDESESDMTTSTTSTITETTGRIIIGLFGKNAPTAAENFRLLSTCHTSLCYKNTIFHRIIPNFAIQGGDTTHGNGIGGRAIIPHSDGTYQPYMINATNFNRPYMVAVATPNTQQAKSQFFITTVKAQWLYPLQYTIFGMVLEGRDYLHTIEQQAGTYGGHPKVTVRIVDCGELSLQPYDLEPHY
jgi:peptidylprolyl isomerase